MEGQEKQKNASTGKKHKSRFGSSGYGMLCPDKFGRFKGNERDRLYNR